MKTSRNLSARLSVRLILLVVFAIAPALGLVVYTAAEQQRDAIAAAQQNALRLGRSIAFEHQRWVDEIQTDLIAAGSEINLVRQAGLCDQYLHAIVANNDLYTSFEVVDGKGNYLCTSDSQQPSGNVQDQTWFQRAVQTKALAVGDYEIGPDGKAGIVFAYPVFNATGGNVTSVLAMTVSLQWINDRAAEADLPADSTLTVVDSNGTVLSRYPDPGHLVGTNARNVPIVQMALAAGSEGTARGVQGLEGARQVYGFVPFGAIGGQQPLRIIVGIPENVASEQVTAALRRNVIGLGVVLVLGLAAAWVLGELLVMRHVRVLVTAAQRLAAGDFSARSRMRHETVELGQVADAFDQMAVALEEREKERARAEEQRLELVRAQIGRAAAEAGRERLRAVVETSPVGVYVVDAQTRSVLLANHEWRRIYGVSDTEAPSSDHLARVVYRHADGSAYGQDDTPEMRALLKGETTRAEDVSIELPDGRTVPVLASATPLKDATGRIEATLVVLQDVSRLQEVERMRTEFLGMVSHELRTPLTIIRMAASTIASPDGMGNEQEAAEAAETIDQQADRLASLIDNLRDAVQIEAGVFSVTPRPEDLAPLLAEAQQYMQRRSGLQVTLDVPQGLPRLSIDRRRLTEVMENLLNNAARYSPRDAAIRIGVERTETEVVVRVTNRGPGISKENQAYLFRKFSQLTSGGRRRTDGSGLGLAICKGIVEAHGGRIWVESAEDAPETTFGFSLPLGTSDLGEEKG